MPIDLPTASGHARQKLASKQLGDLGGMGKPAKLCRFCRLCTSGKEKGHRNPSSGSWRMALLSETHKGQ